MAEIDLADEPRPETGFISALILRPLRSCFWWKNASSTGPFETGSLLRHLITMKTKKAADCRFAKLVIVCPRAWLICFPLTSDSDSAEGYIVYI